MTYRTAKIRQFLRNHFSPEELLELLFDYFLPVYQQVTSGQNKNQQIQQLLDHCHRHGEMEKLLDALGEMRPKQFDRSAFVNSAKQPSPQQSDPPQPKIEAVKAQSDILEQEPQNLGDSFIHPITGKEMVKVPAGPFFYEYYNNEVYLDSFWIDKTPVTQAEYQRFIDANPNRRVPSAPARFWLGGARKYYWSKTSRKFPFGLTNHPVVLVSWYDAEAYARWAKLQLPTERQWEKAARGTDGRKYPWGDEWQENHCNSKEAGIGGTSPVGQFSPQGDSPYGCVDMSGNVGEWVKSGRGQGQVIRGGDWSDDYKWVRVVPIIWSKQDDPNLRNHYFGFRLVSPVAIISGS